MPLAALLPLILSSIGPLIKAAKDVKAELQRKGEWTPEQDQQFQAALDGIKTDPDWKPMGS